MAEGGGAAEDDRARGAEDLAGDAGLEGPELVGAADEHVLDGQHPTPHLLGHDRGTRVARMKTLMASAPESTSMAAKATT